MFDYDIVKFEPIVKILLCEGSCILIIRLPLCSYE